MSLLSLLKSLMRIIGLSVLIVVIAYPFLPQRVQHYYFSLFTRSNSSLAEDNEVAAIHLTQAQHQTVSAKQFIGNAINKNNSLPVKNNHILVPPELKQSQPFAVNNPPRPLPLDSISEHISVPGNCQKTPTLAIADKTQQSVYRWQDKKGRWHFGDQAALRKSKQKKAEDVSTQYIDRLSYFKLNLRNDGKSLPAFSTDRIRSDTRQIFALLSAELTKDHLRQVFLNIRIINSQQNFQKRLKSVAPSLVTNSGFFSTKNNEAVIWRNRHPAAMHSVIRHESTHVIMAGLFGYPPLWLNEGLAEYFERMRVKGNGKEVGVSQYWVKLLQKNHIPLQQYLQLDGADWRAQNQHLMYAHAWSLVHFFMSSSKGKAFLAMLLDTMAEQPCTRLDSLALINQHYQGGINALQQNWQEWLKTDIQPHYY